MGNCINCGHRPSPKGQRTGSGSSFGYATHPQLPLGLTGSSPAYDDPTGNNDSGTVFAQSSRLNTFGHGPGPPKPHNPVMTSSSFPETGQHSTTTTPHGQNVVNQNHGHTPSSRSLESTPSLRIIGSNDKTQKKTTSFYSRIPPLGRSGSVDKKHSSNGSGTTFTVVVVKDNNNEYNESKIQELFEKYSDPSRDMILAEGIDRLCSDLELKPEDFRVLLMAWKFGAEEMCRFTRDEFKSGMKDLQIDSIEGLKWKLRDLVSEVLESPEQFKLLYRFTFKFGLDGELGERILPAEVAISLWSIIFEHKVPLVLPLWTHYLRLRHIKGIPRDTWNMFLNFVQSFNCSDDLKRYDDNEAWPSLFDDFVDYVQNSNSQELSMYDNKNFPSVDLDSHGFMS